MSVTQYLSLDIALLLLSILVAFYFYVTRNIKHWSKRGLTEIQPLPLFGNLLDLCLLRTSAAELFHSWYKQGEYLPYLGIHILHQPAILLRDPVIIKNVWIKNFDSFQNRYVKTHESDSVASSNMFLLPNPHWKTVRANVSPIFTSAKLKGMFLLMLEIGENLIAYLNALNSQESSKVIDVKDISTRFVTDVITSCAFGLEVDSLNDPESVFAKCSVDIAGSPTYKRSVEVATFFFAPNLAKLLDFRFFAAEASAFLRKIITDTINLRIETDTRRNDLIDLLVTLKNTKTQADDPDGFTPRRNLLIYRENLWKLVTCKQLDLHKFSSCFTIPNSGYGIVEQLQNSRGSGCLPAEFDGDNLVGQAATFFAAGTETSATAMTFTLYELALQKDLQTKLREEITAAVEETGGKITYEIIMNLRYLDMVLSETLRKYPALPFLDRVASRDFEIPETGFVIEKDTPVYVSLFGLHYDPQYFPDPEKYDPERFSEENKKKIPSCVYMPFGDGPRNCIGIRFGLMQAKLGILRIIMNHEITTCKETPIPLILDPKATLVLSKDRILLRIQKI